MQFLLLHFCFRVLEVVGCGDVQYMLIQQIPFCLFIRNTVLSKIQNQAFLNPIKIHIFRLIFHNCRSDYNVVIMNFSKYLLQIVNSIVLFTFILYIQKSISLLLQEYLLLLLLLLLVVLVVAVVVEVVVVDAVIAVLVVVKAFIVQKYSGIEQWLCAMLQLYH